MTDGAVSVYSWKTRIISFRPAKLGARLIETIVALQGRYADDGIDGESAVSELFRHGLDLPLLEESHLRSILYRQLSVFRMPCPVLKVGPELVACFGADADRCLGLLSDGQTK